jgi:hypothetical protein
MQISAVQLPTQATPRISVFGVAPANCAPSIVSTSLDGNDFSIVLKAPTTGCDARRLLPFNLPANSAAGGNPPLMAGQVYRIRAYDKTNSAAATLSAFRLVDTGLSSTTIAPENGVWWSEASADTGPASAGSGANFEMQDGQLAVGLFGFGDAGAATWYFGSAQPTGHITRVSLVQLANGDPMFSPTGGKPSASAGPRLELEFLSPTRARAWLVRTENGRDVQVRALTLARTRFASGGNAASPWSGQWVLVPDDNGAPRVFEFTESSSQDADTFHLGDATGEVSLDCRMGSDMQQPDACALSAGATTIADFDQIGFDRLTGHAANGAGVKLLRVSR